MVSPSSFENVKEKWVPEITHHSPTTPFLLVGTKVDLRDHVGVSENYWQKLVSLDMAETQAKELGAVKYVECSSLTNKGVKNVFDEAILSVMEPPETPKKKKCLIL